MRHPAFCRSRHSPISVSAASSCGYRPASCRWSRSPSYSSAGSPPRPKSNPRPSKSFCYDGTLMNICVVGAGYVGLVTGTVFADLGNEVVCVDNVAEKIDALQGGRLPIYEPGLEEMVTRNVGDGRLSFTTDLVSNPEFLREGSAIEDTLRPDRIVIGAPTQQVAMTLLELYAPLERPMIITDVPSAEMIKYASNAFLATKISFINAVANICELAGADVAQVMKGMGLDARIGPAFLQAGLGYGGSCFPKDTDSLVHTAATLGYKFDLLRAVVDVNVKRASHFVSMIERALAPLDARRIAILGLAFKPNTDDMRDAKSIEVITRLVELGATVSAYDPVAMTNARKMLPTVVEYADSPYAAAAGADGVALITEWNEFKFLNLERLRAAMRRPVVFDGRNLWEAERMRRLGFDYYSIGRKPVRPS